MSQQSVTTRKKKKFWRAYFLYGDRPTWEVAYLFPAQGHWTELDYFDLETGRELFLVELSKGRLEVLPVPTQLHQIIAAYFYDVLRLFVRRAAPGMVLFTGLKVRLRKGEIRLPDVAYMKAENAHRRHEPYWDGADLLMEVVSGSSKDRARDLKIKRREYASARIPEYWVIDPKERVVLVLVLHGRTYRVHGKFTPGMKATSVLLPGFEVSVSKLLNPPGSDNPE